MKCGPIIVSTTITTFLAVMALTGCNINISTDSNSTSSNTVSTTDDSRNITDDPIIKIYIADDTTQSDIDVMETYIRGLDGVKSVSFTTKEQALTEFKDTPSSSTRIIDQLSNHDNPMSAFIRIEISDYLETQNVVDKIRHNELFAKIADKTYPIDILQNDKTNKTEHEIDVY